MMSDQRESREETEHARVVRIEPRARAKRGPVTARLGEPPERRAASQLAEPDASSDGAEARSSGMVFTPIELPQHRGIAA
jgi:hypothetical protein